MARRKGTQFVAPGWDDFAEVMEEVGLKVTQQQVYPEVYSKEQVVEEAVSWFQRNGFPYRKLTLHECMQEINFLATTDTDSLPGTSMAYSVADTYHPHRFHAHATGKISPVMALQDERRLRRAIMLELGLPVTDKDIAEADEFEDKDGESVVSGKIGHTLFSALLTVLGTQACANFRPGYAAHLYRRYCATKQAKVLDTSTGYGGRLVGAIASGVVGHYVGIDPNVPTFEGNLRLARDLVPLEFKTYLINKPAEDVWRLFEAHYEWMRDYFDFAFTSPPYFAKERYSTDDTQSWVRYGNDKTGNAWRTQFLEPMMQLQATCLKEGAYAIVNIADVRLNNHRYPLKEWCISSATKAGLLYLNTEVFKMNQRVGANQAEGVAEEPVLIFIK